MARKSTKKAASSAVSLPSRFEPAAMDKRLPGRSSFAVARAQAEAARRVRGLLDGVTIERPAARKVRGDTAPDVVRAVSVSKPPHVKAARVAARPDEKQDLRVEKIKPQVCKERPDSSRGNGSGRAFVPWCSRGKRK